MIILTVKEQKVYNAIIEEHYKSLPLEILNEDLPTIVQKLCRGEKIFPRKHVANILFRHRVLDKIGHKGKWIINKKFAIKYYE